MFIIFGLEYASIGFALFELSQLNLSNEQFTAIESILNLGIELDLLQEWADEGHTIVF